MHSSDCWVFLMTWEVPVGWELLSTYDSMLPGLMPPGLPWHPSSVCFSWDLTQISLQFSSIHRHWTLTTLHQALYKAPNSPQPLAEAVHLLMEDPDSGSTTSDLMSSDVVGIWPSINLFLTKPNKNKKVNWICLKIWNKPQLIKCFCSSLTLAQVTFLMRYRMKNHKKCT